jgi:hypothetical protein
MNREHKPRPTAVCSGLDRQCRSGAVPDRLFYCTSVFGGELAKHICLAVIADGGPSVHTPGTDRIGIIVST